eukprot:7092165-Prorocentrum_lima.AAC.1
MPVAEHASCSIWAVSKQASKKNNKGGNSSTMAKYLCPRHRQESTGKLASSRNSEPMPLQEGGIRCSST